MNFQCEECNFSAIKREELKSHVDAVHRNGNYQCAECDFAAVKRDELKSHMEGYSKGWSLSM